MGLWCRVSDFRVQWLGCLRFFLEGATRVLQGYSV